MIILTNNIGLLLRGLDFEIPTKPIRVALFRAANEFENRDPQGVLYLDDYTENGDPLLREWDDVNNADNDFQYHGEQYNATEFLAGCHVWGVDVRDHYDDCECVTVYVYREGL